MKKIYLLLACMVSKLVIGQITIASTDMPVVGDTIRFSEAATTGLNPATINNSTGANYTWNYSSLVPTGQFVQSFKSSLSSPYFLYFSGMVGYKRADSINYGPMLTQKNVWDFYKTTTTKFTLEGTGFTLQGIPLASDYNDPDELYYFPLNYNDVDSGTFSVTTSIPGIGSFVQAGKRKNTVDGWGKITTPFGTFDVIRVKSVITEVDTIKLTTPPISFPIPNNRIEFKWLAKGIHIPMLEIIVSTGVATQVTSVKYRDQYHYIPVAPVTNFVADITTPKINDVVTITDLSTDIPTQWKWTITPSTFTFANGTTDVSKNIQVKFSANGNYTVALVAQNSAGSNTMTKTAYIKVGDAPVIKFGADKVNTIIGDMITLADSSTNSPTKWKWTILPSTFTYIPGSTDTVKNIGVKFTKGGFYTIDLKVTNAWGSDQATKTNYIWVNFPSGINNDKETYLQVYPNPVKEYLKFSLQQAPDAVLNIYNSCGALVYNGNTASDNSIDVRNLPTGIYFIELQSARQSMHARFVKE